MQQPSLSAGNLMDKLVQMHEDAQQKLNERIRHDLWNRYYGVIYDKIETADQRSPLDEATTQNILAEIDNYQKAVDELYISRN